MDNADQYELEQTELQEAVADGKPIRRNLLKVAAEWVLQMLVVVLVVVLMNMFLCRLVLVSGDSMYPTLYDGDLLMIRLFAYEPAANDILVCETDEEGVLGGNQIVKRCIATAGQTVFVDYVNNTVAVDGVVLSEDYINLEEDDPLAAGGRENTFYLVPEGHIFVLGDNRNFSADSRDSTIGLVSLNDVVGGMLCHIPLGMWFGQK